MLLPPAHPDPLPSPRTGEQDDNANGDNDKDELVNIAGEWKDQDHYALLGLENLRWRATQDDIKKARRLQGQGVCLLGSACCRRLTSPFPFRCQTARPC